jgi:thiamine-monophosphate kinase
MDVSDGLVQDLGHLCRAGACGAEIEAAAVPLSEAARALVARDPALLATVLTGGDDYELLFATPPEAGAAIRAAAEASGTPVARIGRFRAGPAEVAVRSADGTPLALPQGGWSHF